MSLTFPTVTGYSAFWELNGDKVPYAPISRAQRGMRSPLERHLARTFKRNQLRELVEVMITLNGAAAGQAALATYPRRQAPAGPSATVPVVTGIGDLGGAVAIETVTVIDRVTTAADETYVDDILNNNLLEASISYPTVSGSGGGGKGHNGTIEF